MILKTIFFQRVLSGMLNLDTHIVIKALEGTLSEREQRILSRNPEWCISGIVLWEITKLHQIGRIRYGLDYPPLFAALENIHVWPITREICLTLHLLDFQSDPADEIIAATSLTHQIPLLTRDARIRSSKLVNCL